MTTVYADSIFFINGLVNYIILICSARICDAQISRLRLAAAAALGGVYAVLVCLPRLYFLSEPLIKVCAGAALSLAAFGGQRRLFKLTAVFFTVSAAFGGAAYAASLFGGLEYISLRVLAVSFAVCYAALSLLLRRTGRSEGGTALLELTQDGRTLRLTALIDTGNSLTDPLTGRAAVIVEAAALAPLFSGATGEHIAGLNKNGAAHTFERIADRRFRLLPYSAVGVSDGLLVCFTPDKASINGRRSPGLVVALSPNRVSDGGAYTAIMNSTLTA